MNQFRSSILFFLTLFSTQLFSQNITIENAENNEPISFVTILIKQDNKLVLANYSNENGEAHIDETEAYDQIELSCPGFENKIITKDYLNTNKTIILNPKVIHLDEVILEATNKEELQTIGLLNESKTFYKHIGTTEIGLFIENQEKKPLKINSLLLKTEKNKDTLALRVHFYQKRIYEYKIRGQEIIFKTNIPGESIDLPDIFKIAPKKDGLVELDLEKYNLELPAEGIWVVVEPIGELYKKEISRKRKSGFSVEFHQTVKENYSYKAIGHGWINSNHAISRDYKYALKRKVYKKLLIAPSFGLKVSRLNSASVISIYEENE